MDFTALVKELGIDKLPADKQQSIFEEIVASLQASVAMRLSEELDEGQQKRVEELLSRQGDEAAINEVKRLCPNLMQIYQEEIDKLKEDVQSLLPSD